MRVEPGAALDGAHLLGAEEVARDGAEALHQGRCSR
jgi:hypothetical protein